MKPVIFSKKSQSGLEKIADYIALDNPKRALSFVKDIKKKCQILHHAPEANPRFPELGLDARYFAHGNYLILYRMQPECVRIERILHGARLILPLLKE